MATRSSRFPSAGGAPTLLAPDPAVGGCGYGGLAWSPDGGTLAVAGGRGIYLVTLGARPSARLAIAARCTGDPSFSPDGTQITFDSIPLHALGEQTAIMAARIDGSDLRTLSSVPFRAEHPPELGALMCVRSDVPGCKDRIFMPTLAACRPLERVSPP